MRKLKEVLRLYSLGLRQHQIARSCSISQSTVHQYVSAAHAAGVKWPLPANWDDQQIEQALFPQRPAPAVGVNIGSRTGPRSTRNCRHTRT
jgi:transposase